MQVRVRGLTKTKLVALALFCVGSCALALQGVATVVVTEVQVAKTLEGTVVDPSGSVVAGVQVSELSDDGKVVLRATATNTSGKWSLRPAPGQKIYHLRFSCDGFNPLEVRVRLDHKKGTDLQFTLSLAT
jgi:hypothetical protein